MDRAALRAMLPTVEEYRQMTPLEQKEKVISVMRTVLNAIEADERQPDDWEIMDLATASSALLSGWMYYALNSVYVALEPPSNRSPTTPVRLPQDLVGFTVERFRRGLDYIENAPLDPFVLTG